MHLIKHVFFLQNIAKAIEESPLPPKTMINLSFEKDTCRQVGRFFRNFGFRSEKFKTKLASSDAPFYHCIGGRGDSRYGFALEAKRNMSFASRSVLSLNASP